MIKTLFLLLMTLSSSFTVIAEEIPHLEVFNIGFYYPSINAEVSRTDFDIAVDIWIKEFKFSIDIQQTNVRLFDRIENMKIAFNNRELDLIVVPPLLIVNNFDLKTLRDGFSGTSTTGEPYDIVILTRKDSHIETMSDVKNKRLVLPKNDELAKVFLNSLLMPVFNKSYTQVFSSNHFLLKQNQVIHYLFFNKADVGVAFLETFNLMAELNPQIKNKIKILNRFPIKSPNYCFFHYLFSDAIRKQFISRALELNNHRRSQEILINFNMTTITTCPVDSLQPFITLKNKMNSYKTN